jgi:hypothetical protein
MSDSGFDSTIASSTKKQHARGWKKPADKPKRPLSAYNIFFQLERDRIVNEEEERLFTRDDVAKVRVVAVADMPKRKDRKIHGKIAFVDLARSIGMKWKSLPDQEKEVFYERARVEKERYDLKVATWLQSRNQALNKTDVDISVDTTKMIAKSEAMTNISESSKLDPSSHIANPVLVAMQLATSEDCNEQDPVDTQFDEWTTAAEIYGYQTHTDPHCFVSDDRVSTVPSAQSYVASRARRVSLDAKSVFEMGFPSEDKVTGTMQQRRILPQDPLFVDDHDDVSLFDDDILKNFVMVDDEDEYYPEPHDYDELVSMNGSNVVVNVVSDDATDGKTASHAIAMWKRSNPYHGKQAHPSHHQICDYVSDTYDKVTNVVQPTALLDDDNHFVNTGSLSTHQFERINNRMMTPSMLAQRNQYLLRKQRSMLSFGWNRPTSQRTMHSRASMYQSRHNRSEMLSRLLMMERADYYKQIVARANQLAQFTPDAANGGHLL